MDEDTKTEIKELVKTVLQEQQRDLLRSAASNALSIVEKQIGKTSSELRDAIDDEVAGCSTDFTFKNNINRSNFNFTKQVNDIWKKTERAIGDGETNKAKDFIQKGKELCINRMEALRIADKEGWDVALAYISEELVTGEENEKRLKKARRDAKTSRDEKKKTYSSTSQRTRFQPYSYDKYPKKEEGSDKSYNSTSRENGYYRKSRKLDNITCWICSRFGHVATYCPNKRY